MTYFKFTAYCLLLIGLYHPTLIYLFSRWEKEDYNYCYLIPFVVLFLIWDKREVFSKYSSRADWKGFVLIFLGLLFFWFGEFSGEYFTLFISIWLVSVGCFWIHVGWSKLKTLAFPLAFALTMFPFPTFIHNKFSLHLQLISSRIGVAMIQLFGLPAYREGNIIDLGFVQLQIVEACSGLRYLFPLLIMGLLVAYYIKINLWKRVFLVLSTIPLAIITNSMRIALTGIIYKFWGFSIDLVFYLIRLFVRKRSS